MKVILCKDVAKLGHRFDIVEVPSGYALNKLIPQGLAQEATKQNVRNVRSRAEKVAAERAASGEAFVTALNDVNGTTVQITAEANEKGHLFEALKSEKIAEALKASGHAFDASQIHVAAPIKEVGSYTLTLKEGEHEGELTIEVLNNS